MAVSASASDSDGPVPPGSGGGDSGATSADPPAGIDPIFQGSDEPDRPTRRASLLFQFFLFPLLIVGAAVGVFLFFGLIGGSSKSPREYLAEVTGGGDSAQRQAAHQLAVLIARERERERKALEAKEAFTPFYADPSFRADLLRAFEDSFPDRTPERKAFLAAALGAVGDPASVAALAAHLHRKGGPGEPAQVDEEDGLRFAIAQALGNVATPECVPPLAALAKDRDKELRNVSVFALAQVRTPASDQALRDALSDASLDVRLNAGAALAVRGDATGLPELEKCLDPAAFRPPPEGLGLSADSRAAALGNAINAAYALKVERLRPRVEALAKDDGDPDVRRLAREILDRWAAPTPGSDGK